MDLAILLGFALLGTLLGGSAGFLFEPARLPAIVAFAVLGLIAGYVLAFRALVWQRRLGSRPRAPILRPSSPTKPFASRFATFRERVNVQQHEADQTHRSTMPFQMRPIADNPRRPRSASQIRRVLLEIRRLLRMD